MNITELDKYRLDNAVKFHDKLNPALWGQDEHLLPAVRSKLIDIANDFCEFLGLDKLEVIDITISGSNAAYTYTDSSDIDLHLIVNLPLNNEVYKELFNAKKYQYNDQNDFTVKGYPVELYVQDATEFHASKGVYSIKDKKWVRVPGRTEPTISEAVVERKYDDISNRIANAIKASNLDKMKALLKKIIAMRKSGLEEKGEFSVENIVFKLLRTEGDIEKLKNAITSERNKSLSLTERKKKKRKKRKSWGVYGGAWYPGYNNIGQHEEDSSTITPGDIGGESINESIDNIVDKFTNFCAAELGINKLPVIKLKRDPEWSKRRGTFGQFDHKAGIINVSVANRHAVDIMRTLAHELVHHKQNEVEQLPANAGETGSRYEDSANAIAGRIMRDFADKHPGYFSQGTAISESSGYIPVNKKEAQDPRYSMAVTVDIKPGEPKRQAAKLGFKTNAAGVPPTANTNGILENLTQRWQALKESTEVVNEEDIFEINMSPSALRAFADSPAAAGMLAGFEAELIFVNRNSSGNMGAEPDYSDDRIPNSIAEVVDFFEESPDGVPRRFEAALQDDYLDWSSDKIDSAWQKESHERVVEYVENNDKFDFDAALEEAEEEYADELEDATDDERKRMLKDYVKAKFEYFVDEIMSRAFNDDIYSEAYEEYRNDELLLSYTESDWFNEERMELSDIAENYGATWPYYNYSSDEFSEEDANELADSLASDLGVETKVSAGYHDTERDAISWILEPDSSIETSESSELPVEIISPPLPLKDCLEILPKFFKWAYEENSYTNSSTGFHMSVSMPGFSQSKLDYVKLAILLGDMHVLQEFRRQGNMYTQSALGKVSNKLGMLEGESLVELMNSLRKGLTSAASTAISAASGYGKYVSINPKEKYIEFRSAGGAKYEKNVDKIQNTLLRYARAMAAAMDPEAEKQEYARKLYKVLTNVQLRQVKDPVTGKTRTQTIGKETDIIWLFSRYAAGEIDKEEIRRITRQKSINNAFNNRLRQLRANAKPWTVTDTRTNRSFEVAAESENDAKNTIAEMYPMIYTTATTQYLTAEPDTTDTLTDRNFFAIKDRSGRSVEAFAAKQQLEAAIKFEMWVARNAKAGYNKDDYSYSNVIAK